jgi:hypothetical protein
MSRVRNADGCVPASLTTQAAHWAIQAHPPLRMWAAVIKHSAAHRDAHKVSAIPAGVGRNERSTDVADGGLRISRTRRLRHRRGTYQQETLSGAVMRGHVPIMVDAKRVCVV